MNAIIYGIGKNYFEFFNDELFVKKGIFEKGIHIIGISDSNKYVWGTEITFYDKKFIVSNIDEFLKIKIDIIIISSELYFEEIKNTLIHKNYRKEQIILVNRLYEAYYDNIFCCERFIEKKGIEIGGPTDIFSGIYSRCFQCDNVNFSQNTIWWKDRTGDFRFHNKILGNIWITEATDMYQISNESYDFVLSSNNLEHIANPLKALKEFVRIIKSQGTVLVVVPMKDKTFDHNREYTTFTHLLDDYKNDIKENDLTHLPEIISKHDYSMDVACGGKDKFIERAMKNIENRCLHHHVFDEICLQKSFEFVGLKVINLRLIKNNWHIIGEKRK